ncbi:MAG: Unknown protein [uncultured Sulfurovum sp.]|uniref:Porin domain-containing protein n=1 Tax=uncultured Sulfurovum sp. TaxID=269237 RepID=A0A6S6T4R0_9BACT|nr:MAG: Unknown protein [uncultured Sulfurovum sp.]
MQKIVGIVLLCFSLTYGIEHVDYGWNVPNTPIYIGGYIDAVYDETQEDSFLFDDIALLVSANGEHFDFLGEAEISHLSLDGKSNNSADLRVNLERFQLSYALNDENQFTVGRFNSDIGYWNQTPVNILQDSITDPHIIRHVFPKATTGLMYKNSSESDSSYSVTVQHNKDIGQKDESIVADRHLALSYKREYDDFSWRVGGGFYREIDGLESRYMGAGIDYQLDNFSLLAELFTHKSEKGNNKPYSAYIQPVWYYSERQNFVLRLERYNDELLGANEGIALLGYTYRPLSNMALKAEYVYHTQEPLDRFVYSFSVMF